MPDPETPGPETPGPETSGPETSGPETSGPETPGGDRVFAGVPDAFGRLWTPHRMAYITGEGKPSGPGED